MESLSQQLLRLFPPPTSTLKPDDQLEHSLYFLLWSLDDLNLVVDGWLYLRVTRQSEESLDAVGLMSLLPTGSVPLAIHLSLTQTVLQWSVQVAHQDGAWLALSDSGRWNQVYLYASGDRATPAWNWDRTLQGSVHRPDA